jgi:hypothetical protein
VGLWEGVPLAYDFSSSVKTNGKSDAKDKPSIWERLFSR